MKIPNSFRKSISEMFYDKEIEIMSSTNTLDEEGGAAFSETTKSSFKGNVNFNNLEVVNKEYGLDKEIDIVITTDVGVKITVGDKLKYKGVNYRVVKAPIYDSHLLIIGELWK